MASIMLLACMGSPLALSTIAAASRQDTRFSFLGLSALGLGVFAALSFLPPFALPAAFFSLSMTVSGTRSGSASASRGKPSGLVVACLTVLALAFFFFDIGH